MAAGDTTVPLDLLLDLVAPFDRTNLGRRLLRSLRAHGATFERCPRWRRSGQPIPRGFPLEVVPVCGWHVAYGVGFPNGLPAVGTEERRIADRIISLWTTAPSFRRAVTEALDDDRAMAEVMADSTVRLAEEEEVAHVQPVGCV
ncbi:hypothetical protein [Fimbriiglobus ruber]|uniref:hypothetical protein n=1 Tax=Fimbriiglobus ruber TaxID=1908690 RepID=UPI000B4A6428|nr:hypothetical protein [Fimbriiglobus ruber]